MGILSSVLRRRWRGFFTDSVVSDHLGRHQDVGRDLDQPIALSLGAPMGSSHPSPDDRADERLGPVSHGIGGLKVGDKSYKNAALAFLAGGQTGT